MIIIFEATMNNFGACACVSCEEDVVYIPFVMWSPNTILTKSIFM